MSDERQRPRAVLGIDMTRQVVAVVLTALLLTCFVAVAVLSWLERSA